MTPPLLRITGLSKSFQHHQVLHNISFTLNEGEILFLLGASGCGKTTLLRLIAGFEQAEKGTITLQYRTLFSEKINVPTQLRELGYVVQEGALFPHLSVYRNIAYGLGNGKGSSKTDRLQIEKVMVLVGISELAERFPHQLSGGQQQRVALARAIAPNPKLILFDEPFSALDEHLRNQVRQEILHILRQNRHAAIFVTHDRAEALRYADQIAVMQQGRILQIGTPKEIYWNPQSRQIAEFIGETLQFKANYDPTTNRIHSALGDFPAKHFYAKQPCQGTLLIRQEQCTLLTQVNPHIQSISGVVEKSSPCGICTKLSIRIQSLLITLECHLVNPPKEGNVVFIQVEGDVLFFIDREE